MIEKIYNIQKEKAKFELMEAWIQNWFPLKGPIISNSLKSM